MFLVEENLRPNIASDHTLTVRTPTHATNILTIVQRDATQSSLFIILQVHSTCFGCQLRSSSGVHKTVTKASGTGHAVLLQRGQASLATPEGGSCTKNMTSTGGSSVYS